MKRAVYITTSWDDGHPSDLRVAELLAKYGLPGTFYVPMSAETETITPTQVRELSAAFEIGAHTLHHIDLNTATDQQARQEILGAKSWVEDVTGHACPMCCAPKGRFSRRHLGLVRHAGYLGLRTVELLSLASPRVKAGLMVMPTTIQAYPHGQWSFARNAIKRGSFRNLWMSIAHGRTTDWPRMAQFLLDRAIERGGVFHLWGHSWELQETNQWRRLEEVLRYISQSTDHAARLGNAQICRQFHLPNASEQENGWNGDQLAPVAGPRTEDSFMRVGKVEQMSSKIELLNNRDLGRIMRTACDRPPRVSIGLPVYNAENFLALSLDSLLSQTFEDLEIVVSDNGSTDRTPEICREFAARDSRVRYFHSEENHGAAWNFNRVFELARGEFFKWAAHDDLCSHDFIERCVDRLDQDPQAVWCHARRMEIDDAGQPISPQPKRTQDADEVLAAVCSATNVRDRFRAVLYAPPGIPDIYGVGRREALAKTGLHRSYYGADRVYLAELALLGPWLEIPERLFRLRLHSDQSCRIPTPHAQEHWVAGGQASRLPRQLRFVQSYVVLILKAPISIRDRLRCLAEVAGFAANQKKWHRLCIDVLWAAGIRIRVPEDALRPAQSSQAGKGV